MAFFKHFFGGKNKKKKDYQNITRDVDPESKWELVGELGDGTFGKVYKAKHRETGQSVAAKVIEITNENELDDYVVEIDVLAACDHPHVIKLIEAFYFKSSLWILIEFCAGGAIFDAMLDLDRGLRESEIRLVTRQLFEALSYLHSSRVIHRDLKSQNILLCSDGTIRLADFGVSAMNKKPNQRRDSMQGTPYWMAPEVIVCETNKDNPYDYRADVWSAGITVIELADMDPPYSEMSQHRVGFKITKAEPPTLAAPSKWSEEMNDFIAKCLIKNFESRPSAEEMLSHPFIRNPADSKALIGFYREVKADVTTTIEDLPDDVDSAQDLQSNNNSSTPVTPTDSMPTTPKASVASVDSGITNGKDDGKEGLPNGGDALAAKTPDETSSEIVEADSGPTSLNSEAETSKFAVVRPSKRKVKKISTSGVLTPVQAVPQATTTKKAEDMPQYKTLTRLRTFEVDGQQVTTKSTRVIDVSEGENAFRAKQAQYMRKIELREMKLLHREEQKECLDLMLKVKQEREQQEKQFDQDKTELDKRYENDLESVSRQQKKEIEKMELQQQQESRKLSKRLKDEQAKELKKFKEGAKRQEKGVKLECDKLPKAERRESVRVKMEKLKLSLQDEERDFHVKQQGIFEHKLKELNQEQKDKVRKVERDFLRAKQDVVRGRENDKWEREERHLHEKHQLLKHQLKEAFLMHRHQMHCRHEKELEQQQRQNQRREEEVTRRHNLEKKQLPKIQKQEYRAALAEFRKTLRHSIISTGKGRDKEEEKDRLKQFEAQQMRKMKGEVLKMEMSHETEIQEVKTAAQVSIDELRSLQVEKKQLLIQQETDKLKEREESFASELREWQNNLLDRKKKLDEDFLLQQQQQEMFYAGENRPESA